MTVRVPDAAVTKGKQITIVYRTARLAATVLALVAISGLAAPSVDPTILNNLVTELLDLETPQPQTHRQYNFGNPRDGWIFVSSAAAVRGAQSVKVILHTADGDVELAAHRDGRMAVHEAMRRQAPYDWAFLKRIGIAENINVILERNFDASLDAVQWWRQGGKILTREGTHVMIKLRKESGQPFAADWAYEFLSGRPGLKRADRDGIMMSEFDGYGSQKDEYPALTEATQRLFRNPQFKGKVFNPYTVVLYRDEGSMAFFRELIKAGSKIVEERYLSEQPTEAEATALLGGWGIARVMKQYQKKMPDIQKHMIWNLGYMSAPPESLNTNPAVNYKVFMDMQLNCITNDPALAGLYGVMWYHSAYADEETLRWSAKLFRHYCIEGRRDMLGSDPYILPHIENPDFADGASGWNLSPATAGSMAVKHAAGYGRRQARYIGQSPAIENQGDYFLWTKRNADRPNTFSQPIKALEPAVLAESYHGRLPGIAQRKIDPGRTPAGDSDRQRRAGAAPLVSSMSSGVTSFG